jgi:hypothetical protein
MQRWKHFTRIGLALVALAAVTTLVTQRQAVAQAIRAALVRNQDEPGRNPYSQFAECASNTCTVTFPPVPAGQRLVVTFVNALIGQTNGALELGGHGQELRFFVAQNATSTSSIVNSPMVAYYDAGETPTLTPGAGTTFVESTLSGYYITLP